MALMRPRGTWPQTLALYRSADPDRLAAAGERLGEHPGCPALVVWGREDPYLPPEFGARLRRRLRTPSCSSSTGAGHWPWLERPEAVERVSRFSRGNRPAPLQSAPMRAVGLTCQWAAPEGDPRRLRAVRLFFVAYNGYQVVRGITDSGSFAAFANAEHVIDLENSLGAFFEPGFQQSLLDHAPWLVDFANFMYLNSHFVITTGFLAWLYLFRNEHFYFVRNMFLVAMGIALVGYALFPTAPPRLFPGVGFTDTIATFTGVAQDSQTASLLVNKYAAVPSMHIAFSLMIAVPAAALSRHALSRAAVVGLSAARLLRHRRHGQPLLVRRRRRRRRRLPRGGRRRASSPGCARRLVVADESGREATA